MKLSKELENSEIMYVINAKNYLVIVCDMK